MAYGRKLFGTKTVQPSNIGTVTPVIRAHHCMASQWTGAARAMHYYASGHGTHRMPELNPD